jgi:EAL domain-containing protein (putative c-di-GMP-specific phosphodiesterase class I)/CheY-like chemotaxis protein
LGTYHGAVMLIENSKPRPAPGSTCERVQPDAFVIDDEDGIRKFICAVLEDLGVLAQGFPTADEAISALEHGKPDIVFLDIALGQSDAIDVIRMLGQRHYSGMVQLMSGSRSALLDDVHRVGAKHGLNMCPPLEKPFRKEAIRRAVARLPLLERPEVTLSFSGTALPEVDKALADGRLELWYQPKIDLRTRALAGAEGVIRYRHPVHGFHAIDSLLLRSSAETRAALTEHCLVTALRDWDEMDRAGIQLRTAIKASFEVLAKVELAVLARRRRPKGEKWPGLILEVSEHEVIDDIGLAHEIATQLRIHDISLAIDNFGAGFSSFERLRELPFSELKLHPGFVAGCAADARNADICRAAIDLAHRFGVVAVANGLDDESDLLALQSMGCDLGQGQIFADPMPRAEFIEMMQHRARTNQAWSA